MSKHRNLSPDEAGLAVAKAAAEAQASTWGQPRLRDRVERCSGEFLA
ncbi:MAG TPA: hypothetical protein VI136_19540 [Verrucomicrobiae bacterium]